jgi:hypothetical protein
MWPFANVESKPRHPKLIKLLNSLVLSKQVLKNGKRLRAAFRRHASKIRKADYADDVANGNERARHISAG